MRLVLAGPPSGRTEENRKFVEDLPKFAPLSTIFPTTIVGPNGLPKMTFATDEERSAYQLAHAELLHLQMWVPWAVEILDASTPSGARSIQPSCAPSSDRGRMSPRGWPTPWPAPSSDTSTATPRGRPSPRCRGSSASRASASCGTIQQTCRGHCLNPPRERSRAVGPLTWPGGRGPGRATPACERLAPVRLSGDVYPS